MYPKEHILLSLLFVIILLALFPSISYIGLVVIFASAVLIDFDHYVRYALVNKTLNLKKLYLYGKKVSNLYYNVFSNEERKKVRSMKGFLHGFEWLIIALIFSFSYNIFMFVFIGLSFHFLLDTLFLISKDIYDFKCLSFYYQYLSPNRKPSIEEYVKELRKNEGNKKARAKHKLQDKKI